MPEKVVDAVDGIQAGKQYASYYGIPAGAWWNVGPCPQVVIRTEENAAEEEENL